MKTVCLVLFCLSVTVRQHFKQNKQQSIAFFAFASVPVRLVGLLLVLVVGDGYVDGVDAAILLLLCCSCCCLLAC